ncbi:hypothetical protein Y032_0062g3337 [Ancylostoma ceylanicum]|uniref:Uncharacterized protein n=1 Tax=Ancylostoma ceylanicum TaxID=53326 RepID=A0A016U2K6_9BILA|nr:hypothetical protein Y032_0062g3337 [Ancylostoma ceylanicum]
MGVNPEGTEFLDYQRRINVSLTRSSHSSSALIEQFRLFSSITWYSDHTKATDEQARRRRSCASAKRLSQSTGRLPSCNIPFASRHLASYKSHDVTYRHSNIATRLRAD